MKRAQTASGNRDPFVRRIIWALTTAVAGTGLLLQLAPSLAGLSAVGHPLLDAILNLGLALFASAYLVACVASLLAAVFAAALKPRRQSP